MVINFMFTWEYWYEFQRSMLDGILRDPDLVNFLMPYTDEDIVKMTTILNEDDLKLMNLFNEKAMKEQLDLSKYTDGVSDYTKDPEKLKKNFGHGTLKDAFGIGGSNAWVVSGKHTKSGKPLLAGDPHLINSLPGPWYLQELEYEGKRMSGAIIAGMPYIAAGRMEFFAVSETNSRADQADLYLEQIEGEQYFYDGKWKDLEKRKEVIKVRGK